MEEGEFAYFVGSMPRKLQAPMSGNDLASTAYWKARRAGWSSSQLVQEGMRLVGRNGGVGLLIQRLRQLADNPPAIPEQATESEPRFVCHYCGKPTHIRTGNGGPDQVWVCVAHLHDTKDPEPDRIPASPRPW